MQKPTVILVDVAEQMGQAWPHRRTDRNGVAVPPAEVFEFFDGMAKRMSVVEEFTQSGFFEVGGHMVRLHRQAVWMSSATSHPLDEPGERRTVERAQLVGMVFKAHLRIHDETGFRHFAQTFDEDVTFGNEASAPMSASTPAGV